MTTWIDYGLAGLVSGTALYMLRSFVRYIQSLTDRVINSQMEFTRFLQTKYADDLDKLGATLIIVTERQQELTRCQQKIVESQQFIIHMLTKSPSA